jgi:dephospho-CoA kinase
MVKHVTRLLAFLLAGVLVCGLAASSAQARAPRQRQRQRVVVFVGLPGAGKTTVAKRLTRNLHAPRVSCGNVVRGWVKAQGLPYTPQNDRMAARRFAKRPGAIARALAKQIKSSGKPVTIIDGVRSPQDMKVLQQHFAVDLVAVTVPKKQRFSRMLARKRFAGETTAYLEARDTRELGLGVRGLINKAPFRIDNSGAIDRVPSLTKQLGRALKASWKQQRAPQAATR